METHIDEAVTLSKPIGLPAILRFADTCRSRPIFIIDGIFLYLESYFWVISLFLIVRESFIRLGLIVIILAVFFGLIFLFLKNSIDRLSGQKVYVVAVALYAFSWALRGDFGENHSSLAMLCMLALITLCTSVFRLSFNKRFFDNARRTAAYKYIFMKSYISQFFLAVFFVIMAGTFTLPGLAVGQLSGLYSFTAIASLFYLLYRVGDAPRP